MTTTAVLRYSAMRHRIICLSEDSDSEPVIIWDSTIPLADRTGCRKLLKEQLESRNQNTSPI